jgi:PAS domain S-box-containing protein
MRLNKSSEGRDPDAGKRVEHKVIYGDGTIGYISVIPFQVHDSEGKTVRTYGVTQDITERKQAELESEKMQALLSDALERANLAPWEFDVTNSLFTFNDHFYKVYRITAEEVGGYTMSSEEYARRFVHPDDIRLVGELSKKAIEAKNPDFSQRIEHRIVYGDGTLGYISVKIFAVKDSDGTTIRTYGINQDITEQKRIEEELLRAQKLESVGLLAGGIAHDFNNILTTFLGNTYMAKMEADPEGEIFEMLCEMETASSRAQALTKQLLTFAKGGAPVKETSSIEEIVTESSIFVLRGSKSTCEFSIKEDLWPVDVDVGQISQVINNMVMNADQALPDGGTVQVALENLTVEDKYDLPIKPGRYVRISIADQGQGIKKENISKVFDPFFTTKSEGSGLGLATSYSIIKKHDGHIRVESEFGEGTTFQIYLPASERRAKKREEDNLILGSGRILVMDDEAPLRRMIGRMLKKLGYEPDFSEDGAEAIETFRAAKDTGKLYDAVILDLTVPGGMGGKEAVKKILEIEPEAKVIVSSGYSDDLALAEFKQYGFKTILPKPYEPQSMSKVLNEVIQGIT